MAEYLDLDKLHKDYNPSIDNAWMVRASSRITQNRWQKPPTLYSSNFFNRSALKYIHYPHIDPNDPNKLRFYDSILDGRKDRLSSMRIGRYLTKYFKSAIGDEGAILRTQQRIVYETAPVKVCFADTEDKIEWVYSKGPRSCMSKPVDRFMVDQHPCRAYAGGSLQVAWIPSQDSDRPGARAVVWPEKKQYVRLYGDSSRLRRGLDDLGYDKVSGFDGALIRRIPFRDTFVVPYVDGEARYIQPERDRLIHGDKFFVLRTPSMLDKSMRFHEICSEWGYLYEPELFCVVCDGLEHHTDPYIEIQTFIVVQANGNRERVNLCLAHYDDKVSLLEFNMKLCSCCGYLYDPRHSVPYSGTHNLCSRCATLRE